MQPQINAIKQLLKTNNAIASQIDRTIVDWLGDSASWENASTYQSIAAFDSGHGSLPDCLSDSSPKNFQALELLWRSRIDLNDARINAEEIDLEDLLSRLGAAKPVQPTAFLDISGLNAQQPIRIPRFHEIIAERDRQIIEERDRQIENLKHQLEVFNSEITRLQLQDYSVVERDRQIKQLEEQNEAIAKQLVVAERLINDLSDGNDMDAAHIKKANSALGFLRRVYDEGGAIVSSRSCSSLEIILAKNDGRFFADKHAEYDEHAICEYVLRTEKLRSLSDRSLQRVRDLSLIQGVTPEEYLSLGTPESDRSVGINNLSINPELAFRDLIELRDRQIENLKLALDAAKKPIDDLQMECDQLRRDLRERDRQIEELQINTKKRDREQFDNLKSHAVDEVVSPVLLEKIAERDLTISKLNTDAIDTANVIAELDDKLEDRDRQIEELQINTKKRDREINWLESALAFLGRVTDDTGLIVSGNDCTELELDLARKENRVFVDSNRNAREYVFMELKKDDRDRQIKELQINAKNHRDQFDNLKSHFEVLLKAIAMNLNALKEAREPDETKEVNGVMTAFRNYDDNLTHHHKTIIVENVQRAIAEEAKKLKGIDLKDFSFDEIPI